MSIPIPTHKPMTAEHERCLEALCIRPLYQFGLGGTWCWWNKVGRRFAGVFLQDLITWGYAERVNHGIRATEAGRRHWLEVNVRPEHREAAE